MENRRVKETEDSLVKAIEGSATKAFDPSNREKSSADFRDFNLLISQALNILIKPGRVPNWLHTRLMTELTRLPQRPDGVRAILEFVFSVHPSSTVKMSEVATPQKQGANITMEALKMASNLLSVPPADTDPREWFTGIAPQLLTLLDGKDGTDLAKVAAYVIGFGILGRRKYGSLGSAGWDAFAFPMLANINPSLATNPCDPVQPFRAQGVRPLSTAEASMEDIDNIIDVSKRAVISEAYELAKSLGRLTSLLNSHPNPGLTRRLLHNIVPQLWALSSWPQQDEDITNRYSRPAKTLLVTFLKLSETATYFHELVDNLLYKGESDETRLQWIYECSTDGGIHVRWLRYGQTSEHRQLDVGELESKATAFVQLLQLLDSHAQISALFLVLLRDSLAKQVVLPEIKTRVEEERSDDPRTPLIKAKVLQKMLEMIPDKLVHDPKTMLSMVSRILRDFDATSEDNDSTAIALSLLNLVVTTPNFRKSDIDSDILSSIETSLDIIRKARNADVSQTAHNLSLLLTYRDTMDDPSDRLSAPTEKQVEDRRTYNLAIQYITEPDSPPPVRSEGLNLLSSLIQTNSSMLNIPAMLALLSSLLSDDEDYTNLRVIKLFTQLATRHPKSVTKEILEHYVDADEKANTDIRLRFGEALLQVIQRLGETFTGDIAATVCENLLATAGRRGHRPKTEKRQLRDARARARKHKEASDAWGGEVPDLGSDDERTEEERARDEAIARIIGGWESRRGSEDVRVRASALSIFAAALETNAAGPGATLVEASVDLCLDVLTLERGPETGILRRAAVHAVLALVRAVADAREERRHLGFGLPDDTRADIARVLRYVAQTDADGLVQHNARQVAESLENWTLIALLPPKARGDDGPGATLTRLAGLNIGDPRSLPALRQEGPGSIVQGRPRIEEVE
ncbi:hypothetical protein DL764_005270 [Monosporascus ibericus]|uniref:RNA polymerase II assembly factor Rtp1 C-terminal domain-containing protein n=1 Tax=Monosporascus ibericus TaxID=155417 RepID=A0A4Q4TDF4_9PEZI|nr:hypothetical protein DL764_005270 [Monosporascus ibericus]